MANPAVNIALIAAASRQQASSESLLKQLREAGATSAKAATRPTTKDRGEQQMLVSLASQGVLRDVGGGRYWVDETRIAERKASSSRVALILVVFLLSVSASVIALALSR